VIGATRRRGGPRVTTSSAWRARGAHPRRDLAFVNLEMPIAAPSTVLAGTLARVLAGTRGRAGARARRRSRRLAREQSHARLRTPPRARARPATRRACSRSAPARTSIRRGPRRGSRATDAHRGPRVRIVTRPLLRAIGRAWWRRSSSSWCARISRAGGTKRTCSLSAFRGSMYVDYPPPRVVELGRAIAEAGADLVLDIIPTSCKVSRCTERPSYSTARRCVLRLPRW
jgi:hypothetical protein